MSEREPGEEVQRRNKTRGGKKTRRKHELFIEVAEGRHIPKARISDTPIGETGLDLERIRSLSDDPRDVVPEPKFTTSVVRVPPPSAKAKAASAIVHLIQHHPLIIGNLVLKKYRNFRKLKALQG